MPASTVTLGVPAGATQGWYMYSHNNATSTALNTYGVAITAFTLFNNLPVVYSPTGFNVFTSFSPMSAYIINNSNTITVQNDNNGVFPARYVLTPNLNLVILDRNAVEKSIVDAFTINGVNQISKVRQIFGAFDNTDINNAGLNNFRFRIAGSFNPAGDESGNTITKFKPGSAYLVDMKAGETITFEYVRLNQYIITDSGNTPPTGPNNIICCENGDRLTTGVQG